MMRLHSKDGETTVTFEPVERDARYPSLRVNVVVRTQSLQAHYEVWFEQTELEDFSRAMATLERTRDGHAQLRSVSPAACDLVLRKNGQSGAVQIEIVLEKHRGAERVALVFDLDPSMLIDARDGSKRMCNWTSE